MTQEMKDTMGSAAPKPIVSFISSVVALSLLGSRSLSQPFVQEHRVPYTELPDRETTTWSTSISTSGYRFNSDFLIQRRKVIKR